MTTLEEIQILDIIQTSIRNYPICITDARKDMQMILGSKLTLKQIQCEAAKKGYSELLDNNEIELFLKIIQKIRYEKQIPQDNNLDSYPFSDKVNSVPVYIEKDTYNGLYGLADRLEMRYTHVIAWALILGYRQIMEEAAKTGKIPRPRIHEAIKKESENISKFLKTRTLHKIVDAYDVTVVLDNEQISLRVEP